MIDIKVPLESSKCYLYMTCCFKSFRGSSSALGIKCKQLTVSQRLYMICLSLPPASSCTYSGLWPHWLFLLSFNCFFCLDLQGWVLLVTHVSAQNHLLERFPLAIQSKTAQPIIIIYNKHLKYYVMLYSCSVVFSFSH